MITGWRSGGCGCDEGGATGGFFLILWESLFILRGGGRGPWSCLFGDLPEGMSCEFMMLKGLIN